MNPNIPPPPKRPVAWNRNRLNPRLHSWITGLATAGALLVQSQFAAAQQTAYNLSSSNYLQDFSDIANWAPSYASGLGASNWRVAASVATSTVIFPTVFSTSTSGGVQKGTSSLVLLCTGTNGTNSTATDLLMDFTGRKDGVLSFDYSKIVNTANATPRTSDLKIQVSVDNGLNFTDATGYTIPRINNNSTAESGSLNITLPSSVNDQNDVVLRFFAWNNGQTGGSGNRPKWSIDNVAVASTALSSAPVMTTAAATSITANSATLGGSITDIGGATPSERGIYYSTTDGFATGTGTKVSDLTGGFGTGSFTQEVSGLDAGTTYYYRAFATNTNGPGYGAQASFITIPGAPATPTASAVTSSGFTVEWSAVTGAASYRLDVATDGTFTSFVTGFNNLSVAGTSQALSALDPATTYYARVRAINSSGTSANSARLTQATAETLDPVVTLSPNTLSGFSVAYGSGASASQSFTVTGSNLSIPAISLTLIAAGTDFEVSSDNITFGTSATFPYAENSVVATAHVRLKAGTAAGTYNNQVLTVSGGGAPSRDLNASGTVSTASAPTLVAAATVSVDSSVQITFVDNALWRAAVTGITINGTPLTAGFSISPGMITLSPFSAVPSELLRTSGERTIVVTASNHANAGVSQTATPGAGTQLVMGTQPAAPSVNGGLFATQPVVRILDQYGNLSTSTETVNAAPIGGEWTLGGTTSVAAVNGVATFTNLTASSSIALSGLNISFSAGSLSGITSGSFNLVAPPPANDQPTGAITLLPNTLTVSGTFVSSTPMTGATLKDVWYSFMAVGPSATVTINTFSPTGNRNLYVYSALPTTYSTTTDVVASGVTTSTSSETATATGLVPGNTYYILVQDVAGNGGTFLIGVANTPAAPTTLAAGSISTTGFTANWNPVPGISSYRVDVYKPTPATTTDLIVSEYVEGSSNNKYIEIYNGTSGEVNLSDYELRLFNNGAASANSTLVLSNLTGGPATLASGTCLVIRNASAALTLPAGVTSYVSTANITNFNGDDVLALYKVSTTSYIDIFGRIGDDPGTAWTSSSPNLSTLDKTLRRKSTITTGVATNPTGTGATAFTTLATEWDQFDTDVVSGLGSHEPIKEYVASLQDADAGSATSLAVTGLTSGTGYAYVVRAVAGSATSSDSDVRSVSTTVVNQLPTFSGYTWNTGVDEPVAIAESAILANTADANGDTVTISAVASSSAEGGTVARMGSNILYTPSTGFTGTDTFSVTFSDGTGTVNGTITIIVGGSDPLFTDATMNAVLSDQPGGAKRLSFTGIPGRIYGIQRSGNLSSWTQIDTVAAPPGGAVTFDDPSPLPGKGFYRIIYPVEPGP